MDYRILKKEIKKASADQKADKIVCYIAWTERETLTSNFITDCTGITDDQLIKAIEEGLLVQDWDVLEVI